MRIRAVPLTEAAYAPFGDLVAAGDDARSEAANQGTARKWARLAKLENLRPGALANVSVFRPSPTPARPVPVRLLERHPSSTQLFVPMSAKRYLVVVAHGGERPDVSTLAAFVASGTQAITYRPGTWHHPLIALDAEAELVCVVWEDGTAGDCALCDLAADEHALVDVP